MSQNLTIQENENNWTMVIRPQRGLFDIRLRELWNARDLIGLFVWRDFVSVYKQTILGPLWYLISTSPDNCHLYHYFWSYCCLAYRWIA